LYGSHFTGSPVQGSSEQPTSSNSSQFHSYEKTVVDDDLSSDQESDNQFPALLLYPLSPLGKIKNPIIISDDEEHIESSLSRPSYHEA
jgi:hypothetical protein